MQVQGSSSGLSGSSASGIVNTVVAVVASTGSPQFLTISMAGLPSCSGSWPCCWWPELAGVGVASRQLVVKDHQRLWQALDVPLLGLVVSGFFLRTDCLRTALRTCRVRASRASVRADAAVISGCLLAELSLAEAVTGSAAAAA